MKSLLLIFMVLAMIIQVTAISISFYPAMVEMTRPLPLPGYIGIILGFWITAIPPLMIFFFFKLKELR